MRATVPADGEASAPSDPLGRSDGYERSGYDVDNCCPDLQDRLPEMR
jgi:hypothetical protein